MEIESPNVMNLCLVCRRRLRTCLCEFIQPFATESRFLILMHPMEFKKEKVGTGRFSHLILKNSRILVDVGFDENKDFLKLLSDPEYETYVLYPGEKVINLSQENPEASELSRKRLQFVVIDGTWPCAKKMMKLTTTLHHYPRVSFTTQRRSEFKVKHQPLPECLSTVESLHQVILELNRLKRETSENKEENLMDVFRKSVDQQITLAQDPARQGYRRKPFSLPEDRKISKKWGERLLFFRGEES
jgi:DTW domain-containing protein